MTTRIKICTPLILCGLLFFSSCMRNRIWVPPITESPAGVYNHGKFVWHDLLTDDIPAAKKFYQEVFGWEFRGRGGDGAPYLTAYRNDLPVAGLVKSDRLESDRSESRWIGYISVREIDRTLNRILSLQGIIFSPPRELSDRGLVALGGDPGGAIFGLITAWEGDPEEQPAELNTWMWNELLANDADTLTTFYEKVFGYTSEPGTNDYRILKQGDRELAGVAPVPVDLQTSLWLSYIRVADLTGTVSRVTAAGGKILYPMESGRDINQVAILEDTAGAIFGVQQWP